MTPDLHQDVTSRLLAEFSFKEKTSGGSRWLREGVCPSCQKKELYTNADHPWVIRCGRLNNCGFEAHVKDLYKDLFERWSDRYVAAPSNPNAAADAYLQHARGFDLDRIRGWYSQETFFDHHADGGKGAASATVRFPFGVAWWERLIDQPKRFGKMKARFKPGSGYAGMWWQPPSLDVTTVKEIWITEGIFNAIALIHHDIAAVSAMSSNNYPEQALDALLAARGGKRCKLVWALDSDNAGRSFTRKWAARAKEAGWEYEAAQVPVRGNVALDWNDMHQRDAFKPDDLKEYRYQGALLLAESANEKGLLIYRHSGGKRLEFDFEFGKNLYWFKLDLDRYNRAYAEIERNDETHSLTADELRDQALDKASTIRSIANCVPRPLYFQENKLTDESWYYFRVEFPHDASPVKNTFSSGQLTAASEFKKRLLGIAPGAMFSGTSQMLERMMERQLYNIKRVETVDFIGYSRDHGCYVLGDFAVKDGAIFNINKEDYFDVGNLAVKSLNQSVHLTINRDESAYRRDWVNLLWLCFGAKGLAALTFWLGTLFAEQIRATQKSYPFLEVVGEGGSGKSTLIEFLWKLFGRSDYEGFDPSKSSLAARARNFAQVSGLPVVLIESDRERIGEDKTHVKSFDWDELKTAYNGRSVRARGVATGGNETYEPPFRGAIVISQNNEVNASNPILQRIVHLTFDKSTHTRESYAAARELESVPTEQVSGFVLQAARREKAILATVEARIAHHEQFLLAQPQVKSTRIAKNHAQLLALGEALRDLVGLSVEQSEALEEQIVTMAFERQEAINSDHPIVTEFWEAFEYLDGQDQPVLNHSRDENLIAVNLNHFIQVATDRRQQVPLLRDLKRVLKASRRHKFLEIKPVNSAIRGIELTKGSTVKCWVFQRGK
ncbi:toprim domain-containing protein [Cupriavidus nantongensis]|uniref:Toprim domain protein n=1 Tax=Cupriavidus nantongensis TaxID=1796606 RepID=A0A142JGR7_9BURK|nr:toprim domain-containing protein [Cupriavidus nantongensis]AMR77279.1 toprim domain protein [Cupriavidus nantongensis]